MNIHSRISNMLHLATTSPTTFIHAVFNNWIWSSLYQPKVDTHH